MSPDLAEQKRSLRDEMRRRRDALTPSERTEKAEAIEERLLEIAGVREAATALLFYSFGSEVPTASAVRALHDRGTRLLLPYLDTEGMEAAEVLPDEELPRSGYGPREPARRVPIDPADVDVVVTPGLAFDRTGHRLGYGGGHYDRYLTRLRPRALRVGVAFSVQLVEVVPAGPEDQRVHVVVTEEEVVDCR